MSSGPRLTLSRAIETMDVQTSHSIQFLSMNDADKFGDLLYAAYKGTVDDEGETLEQSKQEAIECLNGKYGAAIWDSSFAIFENQKMISACLVIEHDGPFIAFVLTHPHSQGKGLGGALVSQSINSLVKSGSSQIKLVVTEANTPALNLYKKLKFQVVQN